MSQNTLLSSSFSEICENKNHDFPLNLAFACSMAIAYFNGSNLKIYDLQQVSSLANFFVIGDFTSNKQLESCAQEILSLLKIQKQQCQVLSAEGLKENSDWILIDLGDFIIHLFLENARSFYDIDSLWQQCPSISIPQEYYQFSPQEKLTQISDSEEEKSYF